MHEQSQTIERDGRFYNVHGQTGEPLAPKHDFERPSYATLDAAVSAARRRSQAAPAHDRDDDISEAYTLSRHQTILDESPTAEALRRRGLRLDLELAPAPAPEPEAPAPDEGRGVLGDIAAGVKDAPRQVLGGARDAVVEAGQALNALTAWFRENVADLPEGPKLTVSLSEVGEADSTTGGLVRSAAQFLTGFLPATSALKAAGVGSMLTRGAAAGAAADFAVFDPHEPRVSNLINDLAPALKNPITDYLAASPDDTEVEGRLKQAIEGLGLGALTEGVLHVARVLRAGWVAKKVTKAEEAARSVKPRAVTGAAPEGYVRLYRGEGARAPGGSGSSPWGEENVGRWFTSDPKIAQSHADAAAARGTGTGRVVYVDVPVEVAEKARIDVGGTAAEQLLPREWADKARELLPAKDQDVAALARSYAEAVEEQRRGTRTHAQAAAEAETLGVRIEDVKAIMPGTAMNDAQAVAVVNVLVDSGRRLKSLAADAKTGDPAAVKSFLQQLYLHGNIDPKRLGVIAEAGRTLSVMNEPVSGMNRFLAQFEKLFADARRGMTPARLAAMVDAFETPEQLAVFARQMAKPGAVDMILEVWINGLLSGPQTHTVNFLSNSLAALWAVPERALAARVGGNEVAKGEALQMLYGLVGSTQDALALAWKAFKSGETSGASKIETRRKTISSEALELTGPLGSAADLLGEVIRFPGRLLTTSDELFRVLNYRAELRAQAYREGTATATSEGLEGAAKSKRAAEIMRDILNDPPATLAQRAEAYAMYATFKKQLGEAGGHVAAALDAHPALRVVMPFYRTPVNLAKYAIERTPLAFVADYPILRAAMPKIAADLAAGGARRDLALARASLGSAVLALAGSLAAAGVITGGGPKDPNLRREKRATGWQPYSLKVGETYYSFNRLDPVGMLLGLAADAADVLGQVSEADAEELATALTVAVAKNVTSKTFLKGLAETVNALSDPERYAKGPIRNLAGSAIPFSALVATTERVADPTLREARTLLDHVMSRIPGLSESLPPRRNLFGEPIVLEGGWGPDLVSPIYTSREKREPVAEEIVRLRLSVDLPPKAIERIELTPEEHDRFIVLAGAEPLVGGLGLKARLQKVIDSALYDRLTDDGKAMELRRWIHVYRETAKRELLKEFPELGAGVTQAATSRRRILAPADPEALHISEENINELAGSLAR